MVTNRLLCSAPQTSPSPHNHERDSFPGQAARGELPACLPALSSLGFLLEGKVRPIKSGSIESLIDVNETDRQLGRLGGGRRGRKGKGRGAGALDEKEMEMQPNSTAAFLILYVCIS